MVESHITSPLLVLHPPSIFDFVTFSIVSLIIDDVVNGHANGSSNGCSNLLRDELVYTLDNRPNQRPHRLSRHWHHLFLPNNNRSHRRFFRIRNRRRALLLCFLCRLSYHPDCRRRGVCGFLLAGTLFPMPQSPGREKKKKKRTDFACVKIQEAGLSFYSYQILIRILPNHERKTFMLVFWFFITAISSFKISILIARVLDILQGTITRIPLIDHLHVGYFLGIAFNEGLCSYFLLKKFFHARRDVRTIEGERGVGLFSYLTRSTEMRLTALTLIGVTRTITYSFQTTAQSATSVSGQVDRFVTTLECLFPMIM